MWLPQQTTPTKWTSLQALVCYLCYNLRRARHSTSLYTAISVTSPAVEYVAAAPANDSNIMNTDEAQGM